MDVETAHTRPAAAAGLQTNLAASPGGTGLEAGRRAGAPSTRPGGQPRRANRRGPCVRPACARGRRVRGRSLGRHPRRPPDSRAPAGRRPTPCARAGRDESTGPPALKNVANIARRMVGITSGSVPSRDTARRGLGACTEMLFGQVLRRRANSATASSCSGVSIDPRRRSRTLRMAAGALNPCSTK